MYTVGLAPVRECLLKGLGICSNKDFSDESKAKYLGAPTQKQIFSFRVTQSCHLAVGITGKVGLVPG